MDEIDYDVLALKVLGEIATGSTNGKVVPVNDRIVACQALLNHELTLRSLLSAEPSTGGGAYEQGLVADIRTLTAMLEKARSFLRDDEWQQVAEAATSVGFSADDVPLGSSEEEARATPLAESDANLGGPEPDPTDGVEQFPVRIETV